MLKNTQSLGAWLAVSLYTLYILMLILRLAGQVELGHRLASLQFLAVIPLLLLLRDIRQAERPVLYTIQIALMLAFLAVEFLLDYALKLAFRQTSWMVITYVVFFFAATGGLLGLAANAGRRWMLTALVLYGIMAILAFVSRAVTGL